MKILIITRSFVREVGEMVKYVIQHAGPSWRFHLVLPRDAQLETSLPASVSFRRIYFSRQIRSVCFGPSFLLDFLKFQPDIVHVFEEYSGLLAFQSFVFRSIAARNSNTMVYSAENIVGNVRQMLRASTQFVMKRADLAFVCSHSVERALQREGFSTPIEVFPLGVDTRKFHKYPADTLKQHLKLDGKFVVGYVGRLLRMKGVFMLLDMLPQLPENAHIVFLGSGPEEQSLRKATTDAGLEGRVHLLGNIPYPELPKYINCLDLGIVPSQTRSRWKEQFGRSIVELMSCEVPVIGSDSGSIPEVLKDGGVIFPEHNLQELSALVLLMMNSSETRRKYGRRGREIVLQQYSTDKMGEQFLDMYRRVMG